MSNETVLPVLHRPDCIRLWTSQDVADYPAIHLLVGRLRQVLQMPVEHLDITFDYSSAYDPDRQQVDGEAILDRMVEAMPAKGFFNFLIVDEAMYMASEDWNFAFGVNKFMTDGSQCWSIASLDQMFEDYEELDFARVARGVLQMADGRFGEERADILAAARIYKLLIKNIARAAGFLDEEGGVMTFPNSLDELDDIPETFLPHHRDALRRAAILR